MTTARLYTTRDMLVVWIVGGVFGICSGIAIGQKDPIEPSAVASGTPSGDIAWHTSGPAPVIPDATEYMDALLVVRVPETIQMGELDSEIHSLEEHLVNLHGVKFLAFAPDSGQTLTLIPCIISVDDEWGYCTR